VKPGIKTNDRSAISFSRINYFKSKCSSVKIDIEAFDTTVEKQKYVNSTSEGKTLDQDIKHFREQVNCIYNGEDVGGLDILSLLYNEISAGTHIKKDGKLSVCTNLKYHNHLFIFTDGYLEYNKNHSNLDLYFGIEEIDSVRKIAKEQSKPVRDILIKCPTLRLKPLENENNKLINLFVMETDDRGFNAQAGTYNYTGDLSDNNILKTVWELWAIESGFKSFTWKTTISSRYLSNDYIKDIIREAKEKEPLKKPVGFIPFGAPSECAAMKSKVAMAPKPKNTLAESELPNLVDDIQPNVITLAQPINSQVFKLTSLIALPEASSKIIKSVSINKAVKVIGYTNEFWKVQVDNDIGFLKRDDVYLNQDLKDLPRNQ
jgi:hypothetical protein